MEAVKGFCEKKEEVKENQDPLQEIKAVFDDELLNSSYAHIVMCYLEKMDPCSRKKLLCELCKKYN